MAARAAAQCLAALLRDLELLDKGLMVEREAAVWSVIVVVAVVAREALARTISQVKLEEMAALASHQALLEPQSDALEEAAVPAAKVPVV